MNLKDQFDPVLEQADPIQEQNIHVSYPNAFGPCYQWCKNHQLELVIRNHLARLKTRKQLIDELLHDAFISQLESKKIDEALADSN